MGVERRETDRKFLSRIILELEKDCSGKRKRLETSPVLLAHVCVFFSPVVVGLNLEPLCVWQVLFC